MCGISGLIQKDPIPNNFVNGSIELLKPRGPDQQNFHKFTYEEWNICLLSTRLNVVGGKQGRQPAIDHQSNRALVYNGEIYNLEEMGDKQEGSDTHFILKNFGNFEISQLNGMFAFGLFDAPQGRLSLARDPHGIKPLFIAQRPCGGIAFSSDLRSLLLLPGMERNLNRRAIISYLSFDYFPHTQTIYEGISKLAPGSLLVWENGKIQKKESKQKRIKTEPPKKTDWADKLRKTLREAMTRQIHSIKKPSIFLSGGIDSSIVAALMKEHSESIQAFSIGFSEKSYDENQWAKKVARYFDIQHHCEHLTIKNLQAIFLNAISNLSEPIGDPSILPCFLISQLAQPHTNVVLTGDGADELFGGYPTYRAHQLLNRLPRSQFFAKLTPLLRAPEEYQSLSFKLRHLAEGMKFEMPQRHLRWMDRLTHEDQTNLFSAKETILSDKMENVKNLSEILEFDQSSYLTESVLAKLDRSTMSHGIEARPFFLDKKIVEISQEIPINLKATIFQSKVLLKEIAKDLLPKEIVNRPKHGFAIPLSAWLKGPLKIYLDRTLNNDQFWQAFYFINKDFVNSMVALQLKGRKDYSRFLWSLIVLEHWWTQNE